MVVEEMREGNKRYVGQQRWKMGWKKSYVLGQGTTTNLRAYCRSDNLCVGVTTDMHGNLGCIWILCISYCNLNKVTR